ncbi:MAG: hypothetical protein ACFCVE_01920 [Phycisphaerae bacterium]
MLARSVIVVAVAVYAVIAGCSIMRTPGTPPAAQAEAQPVARVSDEAVRDGLPYRAVGIQIQRVDWIDKYMEAIDEIADLGADTVKIVVDARQENGSSNRIYLDMRRTPTPEHLQRLIRHAKARGLRVILMPIVLLDAPRGREWRGTLKPESWPDWFESYREILTHFGWIAQGTGVDVLVVGSELVSSEGRVDDWRRTINDVRKVFTGKLTYSSNWDRYHAVPFWDQLDLIGMNSYWKLGDGPEATPEEIARNWKSIQGDLLPFVQKQQKPLIFLEVGWCSMSNAAHEPWDYTTGDPIDLALQQRLYEGFFEAWHGTPELGGFSIWEWTVGEGGPDDRTYTPEGKPAEETLRTWLAKPAWGVK